MSRGMASSPITDGIMPTDGEAVPRMKKGRLEIGFVIFYPWDRLAIRGPILFSEQ